MISKASRGRILELLRMDFGITNCPRWPMFVVSWYDYHTKPYGNRQIIGQLSGPGYPLCKPPAKDKPANQANHCSKDAAVEKNQRIHEYYSGIVASEKQLS